jgi:hypothetical protein
VGTLVRHEVARFLIDFLVVGLVVLAVYRGEIVPRPLKVITTSAAGVVVVLGVLDEVISNHVVLGFQALAGSLVFATVLLTILLRLLRIRLVTISTVFGAVDAYVLVGFTFAWVYVAVYQFDGQFFAQGDGSDLADFLYFSLITLTTVVFGDQTAGSDTARSLVAIEAVLGQVMLVTLVARLVGLMGQVREPQSLPRPTIRRRQRSDGSAADAPPDEL